MNIEKTSMGLMFAFFAAAILFSGCSKSSSNTAPNNQFSGLWVYSKNLDQYSGEVKGFRVSPFGGVSTLTTNPKYNVSLGTIDNSGNLTISKESIDMLMRSIPTEEPEQKYKVDKATVIVTRPSETKIEVRVSQLIINGEDLSSNNSDPLELHLISEAEYLEFNARVEKNSRLDPKLRSALAGSKWELTSIYTQTDDDEPHEYDGKWVKNIEEYQDEDGKTYHTYNLKTFTVVSDKNIILGDNEATINYEVRNGILWIQYSSDIENNDVMQSKGTIQISEDGSTLVLKSFLRYEAEEEGRSIEKTYLNRYTYKRIN